MHAELSYVARKPLGVAFEIPDLLLAQAVANACDLRMVVEIDHHTDCEELEEVLALYQGNGDLCRCLIWRSATAVVVQPMPGRPQRFASLSDAMKWLAPAKPEQVSNISARTRTGDAWPGQRRPAAAPKGDGWPLHPFER